MVRILQKLQSIIEFYRLKRRGSAFSNQLFVFVHQTLVIEPSAKVMSLFIKSSWPGDSYGAFQSSSRAKPTPLLGFFENTYFGLQQMDTHIAEIT